MTKMTATAADHVRDKSADTTSYIVGFVLSVVLTLCAYFVVTRGFLTGYAALLAICGLAIVQFVVQLLCFLHLGGESKPRWKQAAFWFMIMTILIVVVGSIWIMHNLSYHLMPEPDLKNYLHTNEGI